MTLENETNLEDSLADENDFVSSDAHLEDTIREVFAETGADVDEAAQPQGDGELPGDKDPADAKPTIDASEAARILANSKKRGKGSKRQTLEAKDLDLGGDKPEEAAAPTERIEPPARFTVEKKEWFNRQPREAQEEIAKGWNEIEHQTTKVWQDLQREKGRHERVNQLLEHYTPAFHEAGLDVEAGLRELAATFVNVRKDPIGTLARMSKGLGVTPQQLYDHMEGGGMAAPQAQHAPQVQHGVLTKEQVLSILNEHTQTSQQQQLISSAQAEVASVQNAIGSDGRYLYPELQSEAHISRVKPLVEDLRKTQPGISWAEATKRAVLTLRALDGNYNGSPSPGTSPRLPNSENLANIKAASVSVRGRGASLPSITKAKPGESVEESARAVLAALTTAH